MDEIDEKMYKWKPYILASLEICKNLDSHFFRSNLFWTIYKNGIQKSKCIFLYEIL